MKNQNTSELHEPNRNLPTTNTKQNHTQPTTEQKRQKITIPSSQSRNSYIKK